MGLDVTLGVIILIAGFAAGFKDSSRQAVRITGLIACVYLAEPVRDYAKPYVLPYLPTIQPELVDRLLWWVSAVVTYVVLVGCCDPGHQDDPRPEIPGIAQYGRNNQFAGIHAGSDQGAAGGGFRRRGYTEICDASTSRRSPWAEEQVKTSWALKWNDDVPAGPQDLVVASGPALCQLHRAHGTAQTRRAVAVAGRRRGRWRRSSRRARPAGRPSRVSPVMLAARAAGHHRQRLALPLDPNRNGSTPRAPGRSGASHDHLFETVGRVQASEPVGSDLRGREAQNLEPRQCPQLS